MKKKGKKLILHVLVAAILISGCASASPPRDFTSDGCSLFLNGSISDRTLWCDCCFAHDIAYWRGGTEEERKQADLELRQCVLARTKSRVLANLMYNGVRAGGHPAFPTWYRWGYGWEYGRGYEPLTNKELQQIQKKLEAYYARYPAGYCGEKENKTP